MQKYFRYLNYEIVKRKGIIMDKKWVIISLVMSSFVMISGCSAKQTNTNESGTEENKKDTASTKEPVSKDALVYEDNADLVITLSYDNLSDLEDEADVIIIAQAIKPFEERQPAYIYEKIEEDGTEMLTEGYTQTEVVIKNIIKKPGKFAIIEGDNMFVKEPLFIVEENNVKTVKTIDYYRPINEKDDYVIFLKESGLNDNTYYITNGNNGKFSLQNPNELKNVLNTSRTIDTVTTSDLVERNNILREEVLNQYKENIESVLKSR